MGIGAKIKLARELNNLTQKQLAEMVGVTSSAITNYENNTSHPKEPILYKLMSALNVDANFLFSDYFEANKKPADEIDGLADLTPKQKELFFLLKKLSPEQLEAVLAVIKQMLRDKL